MAKNNQTTSDGNRHILTGLLVGTIVGAIAAALIGSPKGKEIREDLYHSCADASKKVCNAAQALSEKSHDLSDRFLGCNHRSSHNLNLIIGAVAGGIIGVSAIIFLTSESTKSLRDQVTHSFECISSQAKDFEDAAHSTADSLQENAACWVKKVDRLINILNEKKFSQSKKEDSAYHEPLNKILDWAVVAAQLFQSLKK